MPYKINNQQISMTPEPTMRQGQVYVPLDEVSRALGGRVSWDNTAKMATATIGQWTAKVRMADRNVDVSGTPVSLSADPYVEQGVMWVPASFFHDAFGYNVDADPGTQSVSIALPVA
jgi:hypothetical protein